MAPVVVGTALAAMLAPAGVGPASALGTVGTATHSAIGGAESAVETNTTAAVLTRRGSPRAYSFMAKQGTAVARWNPCRRIGYRVNARLGGAGALADTKRALARVHAATGLRFAYRGRTRIVPGGRGDGAYPRDTQLVVAWARPAQSRRIDGPGVAGVGGPTWVSAVNTRGAADMMIVKGFAVLNANVRLAPGFGAGPRSGYQGTRGQLLMHEIGHAMGMGHADRDAWQILYPTMTRKRAVWGAGDLHGLRRLGSGHGCLTRALRLRGAVGPRVVTRTLH